MFRSKITARRIPRNNVPPLFSPPRIGPAHASAAPRKQAGKPAAFSSSRPGVGRGPRPPKKPAFPGPPPPTALSPPRDPRGSHAERSCVGPLRPGFPPPKMRIIRWAFFPSAEATGPEPARSALSAPECHYRPTRLCPHRCPGRISPPPCLRRLLSGDSKGDTEAGFPGSGREANPGRLACQKKKRDANGRRGFRPLLNLAVEEGGEELLGNCCVLMVQTPVWRNGRPPTCFFWAMGGTCPCTPPLSGRERPPKEAEGLLLERAGLGPGLPDQYPRASPRPLPNRPDPPKLACFPGGSSVGYFPTDRGGPGSKPAFKGRAGGGIPESVARRPPPCPAYSMLNAEEALTTCPVPGPLWGWTGPGPSWRPRTWPRVPPHEKRASRPARPPLMPVAPPSGRESNLPNHHPAIPEFFWW